MRLRIPPLAVAGLLIVCGVNAGLLVAIATELVSDPLAHAEMADWNPNFPGSIGNVTNRKPMEAYRQILTRPAFFKSREPYVPGPLPPPPAMVAAPPPMIIDPGLSLGGVMLKSNTKKAYLFSKAGARGAWTAEGNEFMGWKVRSINGTGAKIEQMGRSIELLLYPSD